MDVEKQLRRRIVRLQEVGFGLNTKSRSQIFCSSMQGTQHAESIDLRNDGEV